MTSHQFLRKYVRVNHIVNLLSKCSALFIFFCFTDLTNNHIQGDVIAYFLNF